MKGFEIKIVGVCFACILISFLLVDMFSMFVIYPIEKVNKTEVPDSINKEILRVAFPLDKYYDGPLLERMKEEKECFLCP